MGRAIDELEAGVSQTNDQQVRGQQPDRSLPERRQVQRNGFGRSRFGTSMDLVGNRSVKITSLTTEA